MSRLLLPLLLLLSVPALARDVFFVDNSRPGGDGTQASPFATLAQAQRAGGEGSIIAVAEGIGPYDESITLKRGQMLIGSAYGLDAARIDFHLEDVPPQPAVQGPGPTIRGGVYAAGGNVIAGCTIAVQNGVGLSAYSPQGRIDVRKVFFRLSGRGTAISIQNATVQVSFDGGGMSGVETPNGIFLDGGEGPIVFDRFPVTGAYATALAITNRAGAVRFRNASPLKIETVRDAVVIRNNKGAVSFESPLQIVAHGGRGLVIAASGAVIVGGASWIDTTNGAALDVRDAGLEATFDRLSAAGVPPGKLNEGIVVDKLRGHLAVTGEGTTAGSGGTIRNAVAYGLRVEQSDDVRIANVDVVDSAAANAKCPEDLVKNSNVRCSAAVYLRHVRRSRFENLRISGGGAVGINANNLEDVLFDGVDVRGTGAGASDPSMLLQESTGKITLTRCSFVDGAGGGVEIEQRFRRAQFLFDRCAMAAPNRPLAASSLVSIRVAGFGGIDVDFAGSTFNDHAGSAIEAVAGDTSTLSIAADDISAQRLGVSLITVAMNQTATLRLAMHRAHVYAPGSRSPLVAVDLGDGARACVDLAGNTFTAAPAGPVIAIRARSPQAALQVVGDAAATVDGAAIAALIGQRNGVAATVDLRNASVTDACH